MLTHLTLESRKLNTFAVSHNLMVNIANFPAPPHHKSPGAAQGAEQTAATSCFNYTIPHLAEQPPGPGRDQETCIGTWQPPHLAAASM